MERSKRTREATNNANKKIEQDAENDNNSVTDSVTGRKSSLRVRLAAAKKKLKNEEESVVADDGSYVEEVQ